MSTTDVLCPYAHRYDLRRHRPLTRIDIDEDALERLMTLAGVRTEDEAVNLALSFYVEQQERAARISRNHERADEWGAVGDAERLHQAEKADR